MFAKYRNLFDSDTTQKFEDKLLFLNKKNINKKKKKIIKRKGVLNENKL